MPYKNHYRKEKEFEETMDHLQQDIDSLETERGALRDKLKLYAKRGGTHHGMYNVTYIYLHLLGPIQTGVFKSPSFIHTRLVIFKRTSKSALSIKIK